MFKRKSGDKAKKPKAAKKTKQPKQPKPKKPKKAASVVAVKPDMDIYTVLLVISLICNLIAVTLLYLELSRYDAVPWFS